MKSKTVNFLYIAFPFLLTIWLWRFSLPFWNPAGILSIIPIFYCSFVRPINWFGAFSVLICLCLDYKFETVCFWIAIYCLFYAINSFQNIIDITRMNNNGISAFMIFFGTSIFILVLTNPTLHNLMYAIWIFIWTTTLYTPIIATIKKLQDD